MMTNVDGTDDIDHDSRYGWRVAASAGEWTMAAAIYVVTALACRPLLFASDEVKFVVW